MPEQRLPPAVDHDQPRIMEVSPAKTVRHVPLAPHQLTDRITPARDVFILSHVGIPRARAKDWWLDVTGLVSRLRRFTLNEIKQFPKKTVNSLHECAGFPMAPHIATRRVANVAWGGASLATILDAVGVEPEARYLWSYGVDRGVFEDVKSNVYVKDMPLSRIPTGDVLLAYELNGEPLDCEHGFPLRLLIPGYYGTNSVKWLYRLELSDRRPDGPFTTRYYNDPIEPDPAAPEIKTRPVWEIAPESVIVSPAKGDRLSLEEISIWGWAWADGGIRDVEVSTDGGNNWMKAELEERMGWAWQRFTLPWQPTAPGSYTLQSRATNSLGRVQPANNARNCVYEIEVHVVE